MTPLSPPLGSGEHVAWRLDKEVHARTWDTGEGSYRGGGRWNAKGHRAVYCSLDPATTILEVAVHTGFNVLDTIPHILTSISFEPASVHIVRPEDVPNPNWLRPGAISAGQQAFGLDLLQKHELVLVPSLVSTQSWNLIFDPVKAAGRFKLRAQERFALDPRLSPA